MGIFDGIIGSAVSGIGGLVGGILGNKSAADAARENREFQSAEADKQMAFQERMSNSAYTRSMADMKRAGLNPMLAYSQGGASTPSGAAGSGSAAVVSDALGKGISSAIEARRLQRELEATKSQTDLNAAAAKTQAAQTKLNLTNAKVAEAELPAIEARAELDAEKAKIDKRFVGIDALSNRVTNYSGSVSSALGMFNPLNQRIKYPEGKIPKGIADDYYLYKKGGR